MKRFEIITEADARTLEIGTTVVLVSGGQVTPLARDTLRTRRVTVVTDDRVDDDGVSLVPVTDVRRLAIGSDHTGGALKREIVRHLRGQGRQVLEVGPEGEGPMDYPDVGAAVGRAVSRGEVDAGIVIDGAGLGSAMAANKIRGVRAAMCPDVTIARYAREHNGANVITLGSTLVTPDEARAIVDAWLGAAMSEPRYIRRLVKLDRLDRERP